MILCLVPEISPRDGFCDGRAGAGAGAVGFGYSRSWIQWKAFLSYERFLG